MAWYVLCICKLLMNGAENWIRKNSVVSSANEVMNLVSFDGWRLAYVSKSRCSSCTKRHFQQYQENYCILFPRGRSSHRKWSSVKVNSSPAPTLLPNTPCIKKKSHLLLLDWCAVFFFLFCCTTSKHRPNPQTLVSKLVCFYFLEVLLVW